MGWFFRVFRGYKHFVLPVLAHFRTKPQFTFHRQLLLSLPWRCKSWRASEPRRQGWNCSRLPWSLDNTGSEVLRLSRRVNNMAKSTPSFLSRRSSKSEVGWIHYLEYPKMRVFTMILDTISDHQISIAMLFYATLGWIHAGHAYVHKFSQSLLCKSL